MNNPNSTHNAQRYLSLVKDTLHHSFDSNKTPLPHCADQSHTALWLQSGYININAAPLAPTHGSYFSTKDTITTQADQYAVLLRFIVSAEPLLTLSKAADQPVQCETIFSKPINTTSTDVLLRLDQVDFPPAAVAYKHTHPGPGIRYLTNGGLTLTSEHGEQIVESNNAWYEEANSAVTATAISTSPSSFIRTMLLPIEYEGRSSFTLHDQADAAKPRLQSNIRHFEKRIVLSVCH